MRNVRSAAIPPNTENADRFGIKYARNDLSIYMRSEYSGARDLPRGNPSSSVIKVYHVNFYSQGRKKGMMKVEENRRAAPRHAASRSVHECVSVASLA